MRPEVRKEAMKSTGMFGTSSKGTGSWEVNFRVRLIWLMTNCNVALAGEACTLEASFQYKCPKKPWFLVKTNNKSVQLGVYDSDCVYRYR